VKEKEFLTKRDILEYLPISRSTLERTIMKEVPHIRIGKKILFRKSDIDAYLKKKTVNI
jgi:excisionase family DNA binding protein